MTSSFRILIVLALQFLVATAEPVGIVLHSYSPEAPADKIECFEYVKVERQGEDYRFFPRTDRSVIVTAYRFRGVIPYKPSLSPTHPDFKKLLKLYEETAKASPSTRAFLNPKILTMRAQVAGVVAQAESLAKLPTITLADGSELIGCTMTKIENDTVSVMYKDGFSRVKLSDLDTAEKEALNSTSEDWSLDSPSISSKDSTGIFAKIVFKNGQLLKKAKFKEIAGANFVFIVNRKSVSIPVDQFPGDFSVLGEEVVKALMPKKVEPVLEPAVTNSDSKIFHNSLGMKFVPIPIKGGETDGQSVLFSVWETRYKDFKAFVEASGYDATTSKDSHLIASMRGLRSDGVTMNLHWADHGEDINPEYPVTYVDVDDASAFCQWLTKKERDSGAISKNQMYRLPWDHEWSCAVGIGDKEIYWKSPEEKSGKVNGYPWGLDWPPLNGFENYAEPVIVDGHEGYSPVGSYSPNSYGLYDTGGNVNEHCLFKRYPVKSLPVLALSRGGCGFITNITTKEKMLLSYRMISTSMTGGRNINSGFRCVLVVENSDAKVEQLPGITEASKALIIKGDDALKEKSDWKNLLAAYDYYSKAEELGHPDAYKKNRRVMRTLAVKTDDQREKVKWFRKSAERGSANSQWDLARYLYNGYGISEDKFESAKWAQHAAENGHLNSQMGLAESYRKGGGVEKNLKTAGEWYRMAAERGHPDAQYELGFLIQIGNVLPEPGENAFTWYEKSAYQKKAEAQFSMGLAYEDGSVLPKDIVRAYMWLSLASAGQKNTPLDAIAHNPKNVLKNVSKKMTDEQVRAAEKLVSEWKPIYPIAWASREIEELRLNDAD